MNGTAAAIGTFDGVHRGHAAVLRCVCEEARSHGLDPIAITFDRHPLSLIAPERVPLAITTTERKEKLIRQAGLTPVVVAFDDELRHTTAEQWMRILSEKYGVRLLVVGYDNTFGCDGINFSISDYRRLGLKFGIEVTEAPTVEGISSSAIRKAIAAGDVEAAREMLGRPHSVSGMVVEGNRLGRTIGFPTANILTKPGIAVPANGVYAAKAKLPDGSLHPAMVNVGVRPTIGRGNAPTVEAHIIGWKGDLYGHPVKLEFFRRLRDETRFKSIDALRRQLCLDAAATLEALGAHK